MSIFSSKEKDGTLNVMVCGKVSRDPELKQSTKGDRVKFSISYGKSKFMDIEAWADAAVGEIAGRLEKGDTVAVAGVHRSWEYNDKTYQSVTADMIFTLSTGSSDGAAPAAPASKSSTPDFVDISEDDEDELPF